MIDQSTVAHIIDVAQDQITDVISEYVTLKKNGKDYLGNCPFHNEKTPSFRVSPQKGMFKCFGCGKGGNVVHFLMEHEQMTFIEAIRFLGKKFNIHIEEKEELSPEEIVQKKERESMLIVTEFASKFFRRALYESDEGISVGLGYFRQRGFRDDIIRKFELGYSPEKRDAFTTEALKQGYKIDFLEKTGLTIVGENNYKSDRFRGRVMFPIHGLSGGVTAFGGRILQTNAKTAKYLNSPESEIYHKSKILYGIYQAREEIKKRDKIYLVEGYTDVLSFHQAGIANVVASSGTALTSDQIRLMARFSHNITIIYDGDAAGIKASLRGIDLVLEEGMNVKVLLLPDGEDPDSFAKKTDGDSLIKYINENETDFIKFKTSLLLDDSKNDPIKRAQLIQEIVRSIAMIPNPIVRSVYVNECSVSMKVDESVIYGEIAKLDKKKIEQENRRAYIQSTNIKPETNTPPLPELTVTNRFETEEREILRLLICFGENPLGEVETDAGKQMMSVGEYIVSELKQDELQSTNPVHNLILNLYEEHIDDKDFSADKFFVNYPDPDVSRLASDFLVPKHTLSKIHEKLGTLKKTEELLEELVPRVVLELKWKMVNVRCEQCQKQLGKAQQEGNQEEVLSLMQELSLLLNARKVISQQLGDRIII